MDTLAEIERILTDTRHVTGWIGALAPLNHPDSKRAVAEGQALVQRVQKLRDDLKAAKK
jgi:hypothetical protein